MIFEILTVVVTVTTMLGKTLVSNKLHGVTAQRTLIVK
jgi:hypothetical protein